MMATRPNPFYRYRDPTLGAMFAGISEAMFPTVPAQAQRDQSAAIENLAQAGAANAQASANFSLAGYRDQQARGERIRNDRYDQQPMALADLFLNGVAGIRDDEVTVNPLWQPPTVTPQSYDLLAAPQPVENTQPMFLGQTAAEKMAAAIQQMEAYGFKPDDIMRAVGSATYQRMAAGQDPQAALPFAPFAGVTSPNAGTALSPLAQAAISARDALEAQTLERIRGDNYARVASINQAGADRRNNANIASRERLAQLLRSMAPGSKPPAVPALSGPLATKMREQLEVFLANEGYEVDPPALDILFTEAARLYQDPNSDAFKNPVVAAANIVTMLQQGQVAGVGTERRGEGWFDGKPRDAVVRKPNATGATQAARSIKWTGDPQKDRAMVEALPSGTRFIGPDGVERIRK